MLCVGALSSSGKWGSRRDSVLWAIRSLWKVLAAVICVCGKRPVATGWGSRGAGQPGSESQRGLCGPPQSGPHPDSGFSTGVWLWKGTGASQYGGTCDESRLPAQDTTGLSSGVPSSPGSLLVPGPFWDQHPSSLYHPPVSRCCVGHDPVSRQVPVPSGRTDQGLSGAGALA